MNHFNDNRSTFCIKEETPSQYNINYDLQTTKGSTGDYVRFIKNENNNGSFSNIFNTNNIRDNPNELEEPACNAEGLQKEVIEIAYNRGTNLNERTDIIEISDDSADSQLNQGHGHNVVHFEGETYLDYLSIDANEKHVFKVEECTDGTSRKSSTNRRSSDTSKDELEFNNAPSTSGCSANTNYDGNTFITNADKIVKDELETNNSGRRNGFITELQPDNNDDGDFHSSTDEDETSKYGSCENIFKRIREECKAELSSQSPIASNSSISSSVTVSGANELHYSDDSIGYIKPYDDRAIIEPRNSTIMENINNYVLDDSEDGFNIALMFNEDIVPNGEETTKPDLTKNMLVKSEIGNEQMGASDNVMDSQFNGNLDCNTSVLFKDEDTKNFQSNNAFNHFKNQTIDELIKSEDNISDDCSQNESETNDKLNRYSDIAAPVDNEDEYSFTKEESSITSKNRLQIEIDSSNNKNSENDLQSRYQIIDSCNSTIMENINNYVLDESEDCLNLESMYNEDSVLNSEETIKQDLTKNMLDKKEKGNEQIGVSDNVMDSQLKGNFDFNTSILFKDEDTSSKSFIIKTNTDGNHSFTNVEDITDDESETDTNYYHNSSFTKMKPDNKQEGIFDSTDEDEKCNGELLIGDDISNRELSYNDTTEDELETNTNHHHNSFFTKMKPDNKQESNYCYTDEYEASKYSSSGNISKEIREECKEEILRESQIASSDSICYNNNNNNMLGTNNHPNTNSSKGNEETYENRERNDSCTSSAIDNMNNYVFVDDEIGSNVELMFNEDSSMAVDIARQELTLLKNMLKKSAIVDKQIEITDDIADGLLSDNKDCGASVFHTNEQAGNQTDKQTGDELSMELAMNTIFDCSNNEFVANIETKNNTSFSDGSENKMLDAPHHLATSPSTSGRNSNNNRNRKRCMVSSNPLFEENSTKKIHRRKSHSARDYGQGFGIVWPLGCDSPCTAVQGPSSIMDHHQNTIEGPSAAEDPSAIFEGPSAAEDPSAIFEGPSVEEPSKLKQDEAEAKHTLRLAWEMAIEEQENKMMRTNVSVKLKCACREIYCDHFRNKPVQRRDTALRWPRLYTCCELREIVCETLWDVPDE